MTEKYIPNGAPLTPWEEEALLILMEECAEVIMAASKLKRFGRENKPDFTSLANTQVLGLEVGDLEYMIATVQRLRLFTSADVVMGHGRKHERLRKYAQHMPADWMD